MKLFHYVKLHNFKVFGEEKTVDLDQPSVLIGPNNSGKTSILQALALWSLGIKRWHEARGSSQATKSMATGINRLDIIQVPVQEARFFWKNTEIRKGSTNPFIPLEITVGVDFDGSVHDCKMIFTHYTPEVIYCVPSDELLLNRKLIAYAALINVEILYPMSGMITEETLIPEGRINVLIGQGRTAEVLRNLCFQIVEKKQHWDEIESLMKKIFNIKLLKPVFIQSRGAIELKYQAPGVKNPLDISLSGRGQQQILLIIAYLFSHSNAVLLLDEPDAHLEILRQKLVFTLLRDLSSRNNNQVVIATHSEVILEEAADTNLVMVIDGEPLNVAPKKDIRSALKDYGIEHYYKAKMRKSVLYIEGGTDVEILRAFARLLQRSDVVEILDSPIYYYYIKNNENEMHLNNSMDIKQGYYQNHKNHFYALKSIVPEFKGIALFDSDNRNRVSESNNGLETFYWPKYEIENYFITPDVIKNYVSSIFKSTHGPLFSSDELGKFLTSLDKTILKDIFENDENAFNDFKSLSLPLQESYWSQITRQMKLSLFLEKAFETYSEDHQKPILLNKGRYHELIPFMSPSKVSPDISKALDLIFEVLS